MAEPIIKRLSWRGAPRKLCVARAEKLSKTKSQSSQTIDRGLVYVERRCDISNPLPHATLFCCVPTCSSPLADQISLKLSDAGENGHDHFPRVCRGVGPLLGNGLEFAARLVDSVHHVEQVARGSGQAV